MMSKQDTPNAKPNAKSLQEIRISIKHDPVVQEWVRHAKAQHISVPMFALQAIREKIAAATALESILREMTDKMEHMEHTLRDITARGVLLASESVPNPATFVRDTPPDYEATAEELFENTNNLGWD